MSVLSFVQVAAVARKAGFPADAAIIAVAVTNPESGRDAAAIQPDEPYATTGWGLWQITPGDSEPQFGINQAMLDPLNNARAAYAKWSAAGGFSPWTTYTHGLYQPYMLASEAAVGLVYQLDAAQLAAAVAAARAGATSAPAGPSGAADWSGYVRYTATKARAKAGATSGVSKALAGLRGRDIPPNLPPVNPAGVLQEVEKITRG